MSEASTIETLLRRAKQAIAQREWVKAKLAYLQALGLKSDVPDVHYGLATVYFQQRELTSAAHHFREVTRLDPLRAGAYINLGAVLNLLEEYDEAIKALQQGLKLDPQRAEGYYNLGVVYRRKGQLELAITAYREALRINPRMPDAHLNLGNVFMEKENYKQAREHYRQALHIRPGWEKAETGLADIEAIQDTSQETGPQSTGSGSGPVVRNGQDPDRLVDPSLHGTYLTVLHQATIDSETVGRQLLQILEREVEPAIKELSTSLLYRDRSRAELTECIGKFEEALDRIRKAHQLIQDRVAQVETLGTQFPS